MQGRPPRTFAYPEPYLISSPCALADYGTHCGASAGSCAGKHSPGLQLAPGQTAAQQCSRCFALGDVTHTAKRAKNGLTVTTTAGADHRTMDYTFICDRESSAGAGPEPLVVSHGMEYSVTWRTPLACSPTASPGRCPAPPPPPPTPPLPPPPGGLAKPTAAQLRWMEDEIGAIGHFNMGTFEACGIGLDGETTAAGFSPSLALSLSRSLALSLSRSLPLSLSRSLPLSCSLASPIQWAEKLPTAPCPVNASAFPFRGATHSIALHNQILDGHHRLRERLDLTRRRKSLYRMTVR